MMVASSSPFFRPSQARRWKSILIFLECVHHFGQFCGGNIKKESVRSAIYTKMPHVALHGATPSCPSWVWLRKTDTLSNCAMCGLLWAKSFHSNGELRPRLAHSVTFHGKYDLAPGSWGSSGLVLGNFPWVYDHPWVLCGPMGRRKMLEAELALHFRSCSTTTRHMLAAFARAMSVNAST